MLGHRGRLGLQSRWAGRSIERRGNRVRAMAFDGLDSDSESHRHRAELPEPILVYESHPELESDTHIVVGFDEEPQSQAALRYAIDLARRLDADLEVVHVVDLRDYPV